MKNIIKNTTGVVLVAILFCLMLLFATGCSDSIEEELFRENIKLNNAPESTGGAGGDPDPLPPPK